MASYPSPDSLGPGMTSVTYATVTNTSLVAAKGGPCRRVRIGGAGNLAVTYADGSTDVITGLLAGETLDLQLAALTAAGSTATQVCVIW